MAQLIFRHFFDCFLYFLIVFLFAKKSDLFLVFIISFGFFVVTRIIGLFNGETISPRIPYGPSYIEDSNLFSATLIDVIKENSSSKKDNIVDMINNIDFYTPAKLVLCKIAGSSNSPEADSSDSPEADSSNSPEAGSSNSPEAGSSNSPEIKT